MFRFLLVSFIGLSFTNFIQSQELPSRSLKSKFRIQINYPLTDADDSINRQLSELSKLLRINAYLLHKKDLPVIHLGDYTCRENAKSKLSALRKKFPTARIVRANNEEIAYFQIYERRKVIKSDIKKPLENDIPYNKKVLTVEKTDESGYNFEAWNDEKYLAANTAANEDYLTQQEKDVIYYLNLVRMNPPLFAETYLLKHAGVPGDDYEKSLYEELKSMPEQSCLIPNRQCFESAQCHAIASGLSGYVGHERANCTSYFWGECCQYGPSDPLAIVLQLLIDRGVESLGHRRICLGSYDELGISIQPHSVYGSNAVLDFR